MVYRISSTDKKNFEWFKKDHSKASLLSIELVVGNIRGIRPCKIEFDYPISAIAGSNGSGKSTILAMSACAFHNKEDGFFPPLRAQNYYTFKDFFIQSENETPIQGVEVKYGILHNNWRGKKKESLGHQTRRKKHLGRWNDYKTRVNRNVIYFGVQRVVPHFERSVHKSYRSRFKPSDLPKSEKVKIAKIAGRIIGKEYVDFDSYQHGKYSLPGVTVSGVTYSGFNMGAGESAVFEILTALFQSGKGTLVIIDEIELGLHEKAQNRLIEQLKIICLDLKCQIICSTHSYAILNSLPSKARFFIEEVGQSTILTKGISPDFACGKMGKPDSEELDIFVEDENAATIVDHILPFAIRKRCKVHAIGSHSAVLRQLTSRYMEKVNNSICILDGDQSTSIDSAISKIVNWSESSTDIEKDSVRKWAKERVFCLPGTTWPEKWLLDTAVDFLENDLIGDPTHTAQAWGLDSDAKLLSIIKMGSLADKHNEFYEMAEELQFSPQRVREDLCRFVLAIASENFEFLREKISEKFS